MNEQNTLQAFTTKYNGIINSLKTNVTFSSSFKDGSKKKVKCIAIWDTGANNSAISSRLAKQCELVPIGKTRVYTAGGLVETNVYLIDVMLPNRVVVQNVRVTEIDTISGGDALIGMDVMSLGDVAITHDDTQTFFTFEIPSDTPIDFVEKINKYNKTQMMKIQKQQERIKRENGNKPCPCGSGRKYRYCCGKKDKEKELQPQ